MKNFIKNHFWIVILILISFLPLLDFLHPGLPITHDGQDHVARIANFYQNLAEGNLIPRWAGNLNWGYGHPILMFLYPLPSYIASAFHFFGFSLVDSTKIVFALSFILSGFFMYSWIKQLWGVLPGLIAGTVYMIAPYRFVDLYVRGAIGECWAFVWPPLVCFFILKKNFLGIALAVAGLTLSHNALGLMFLPVIFGYLCCLGWISPKKILNTCYLILATACGFLLSAFFWVPALFEGKYTLRDIVTKNQIVGFESLGRLIWSRWNYGVTGMFSVQVGIWQWLLVILSPILIWAFWRRKDKIWTFLLFLFFYFLFAVFLILPQSKDLYLSISLLQKFQFAWRFLSLAVFPPAVFSGALVFLLPRKLKLLAVCFFITAILWFNKDYWHARDYLYKDESFYSGIYNSTTDTGESGPRWSTRFMEHRPGAAIEVISGQAEIEELRRTTTSHQYKIIAGEKTRIRENTLYFPGWMVLVDNQPVNIEFQDPQNRGLMTFFVDEGKHKIDVVFKETKLRLLAGIISVVSLVILALFAILRRRKLWSRFRLF